MNWRQPNARSGAAAGAVLGLLLGWLGLYLCTQRLSEGIGDTGIAICLRPLALLGMAIGLWQSHRLASPAGAFQSRTRRRLGGLEIALLTVALILACGPRRYHMAPTYDLARRGEVTGLKYKLGARSEYVRHNAIRRLADLAPDELLRHPDLYARYTAAAQLGESGDRRCLPLLIEVVTLAPPDARWWKGHTRTDWFNVRCRAARALSRYHDDAAFTVLRDALEPYRTVVRSTADPHEYFGRSVSDALGELGDERAVPLAIEVLYRQGDASAGYVPEPTSPYSIEGRAAKALAQAGTEDAFHALERLVTNESSSAALRQTATHCLHQRPQR